MEDVVMGTSYMFAEMYTLSHRLLYDVVDEQQYTEKASFDLHVQHQNLCMLKFNLKGTAAVCQSHYFAKQGVQDTPKLKTKNLL